jgi:hypothetical protein
MAEPPDKYDDAEARRRFEATLRGAIKTPPQPKPTTRQPAKKKTKTSTSSSASKIDRP